MTEDHARPVGGVKPSPNLFQKWSRAPYWGPEEGVALAFGLDPAEVVEARQYDHPRLKAADPAPHFAGLARRAVSQGDLEEEARPSAFLDWAEGVGLAFHDNWTSALNPRVPAGPDGELETVRETVTRVGKLIEQRDELIKLWALAPTWTLREGACLANNVSPRLLLEYGDFPRRHPAAERVNRLIEFALRSMRQFKLSTDPTPAVFIAWSENVGFPFDAKWIEVIGKPRIDDDWTSTLNPCIPASGDSALTHDSAKAKSRGGAKPKMDKVVAWFLDEFPGEDRRGLKWEDVNKMAENALNIKISGHDSIRNAIRYRKNGKNR